MLFNFIVFITEILLMIAGNLLYFNSIILDYLLNSGEQRKAEFNKFYERNNSKRNKLSAQKRSLKTFLLIIYNQEVFRLKIYTDSMKVLLTKILLVCVKSIRIFCTFLNSISRYLMEFIKNPKLKSAPGTYLLSSADFLYRKDIVQGVFEQIVCNWRTDYFDALSDKRKWKARWISIRGNYEFYCAMLKQSPIGDLIEEIRKFVK